MNSKDNATDTADIASGTKPLPSTPTPTPTPTPKPKPPGSEVDDLLEKIENATNVGGLWGKSE